MISGDFSGILSNAESWNNWVDGVSTNPDLATVNSDGTITFSAEAMQQLRDLFDEYLAENPEVIDVVWVPVITEKNLKASWFGSLPSYNRSVEVVREHGLVGFRREVASGGVVYPPVYPLSIQFYYTDLSGYFPVYIDLSDTVYVDHFNESFINGVTYLTNSFGSEMTTPLLTDNGWILTQNGVVTYPTQYVLKDGVWTNSFNLGHKNYYSFVLNPFYAGVVNYSSYTDYYVMVASSESDIHYVPVFRSAAAYSDYVTGNGNYYRFDSGYAGGDITINPDADYSEITDAIRDAMQQAIQSGKSVTDALSSMQKAFTVALGKINSTLGDISDNTAQTNTWLEMIYKLLEQQQQELQDYFDSAGASLDDLKGLLSHTDQDGNVTSIYTLLGNFLLLFRVQQEDLQSYMSDALQHMKTYPVKIGVMINDAAQDIIDAIMEVVEAVNGITINIDYGDVDNGGSGESLWTQLGKGLAKILTSILNLLKVLIFKGLDALGYLVDVMINNINDVFDGIGVYFDAFIAYIEENTIFFMIRESLPSEIQTIYVLFFFSIAVGGIIRYVKKG